MIRSLLSKIEYVGKEKKKFYNFIILRKILPYLLLKKIYPHIKKKSFLFKKSLKKINKRKKNKNVHLNYLKSKNFILYILYYYLVIYNKNKCVKNKINKKKNNFLKYQKNKIKKKRSKNIIVRVLATTRNVIVSGFSHTNKLEFIYSMAAIKNQNNLKRKTFFACKILIEKLLHFYLYKRNLFRLNNRIIFILYGYNKFYNLIFRIISQNRIFYSGLIFKNNIPYNGCFKKKKKRK